MPPEERSSVLPSFPARNERQEEIMPGAARGRREEGEEAHREDDSGQGP